VTDDRAASWLGNTARRISSELAEFARPTPRHPEPPPEPEPLPPADTLLEEYDRRVLDGDLRQATRSRFVSKHYADAVEAGVKALNEVVRTRSGRSEDGDGLMTLVFSEKRPILRIPDALKTDSQKSEQRGHMMLCQGVVAAWRNPRAHSLIDDSPARALLMLEVLDNLITVTRAATRTRRRN
jgi:uncharacterized protein (TIGR02391 family)